MPMTKLVTLSPIGIIGRTGDTPFEVGLSSVDAGHSLLQKWLAICSPCHQAGRITHKQANRAGMLNGRRTENQNPRPKVTRRYLATAIGLTILSESGPSE